jgi:hypothetical protein
MMLAHELLEKGQRAVVLEYFRLCSKFWSYDRGQLARWTEQVKAGEIPQFGANLVYWTHRASPAHPIRQNKCRSGLQRVAGVEAEICRTDASSLGLQG